MTAENTLAPSAVRQIILNEHSHLRSKLHEIETIIKAKDSQKLATVASETLQFLLNHIDHEEKILLPALKEIDAWGQVRVENLNKEHTAQRIEIKNLIEALKGEKLTQMLPVVQKFIEHLYIDMEEEERDFLNGDLLKDDPITVGNFGG